MESAIETAPKAGITLVLRALGLSRASFYRWRKPKVTGPRPTPARALRTLEREQVLTTLHEPRFVDLAPAEVHATLLGEGEYLCSVRTMYRLLADCAEVRERRNQLRHPQYAKPELIATAPNQVWSWDITKLKTFEKWSYLYLYVVLDIFSRYVVGWLVAEQETAALAQRLIEESYDKQNVEPGQIVLHSDRGPQMRALTTAQMCTKLGIEQSFNRPYVSDDNPFSESQFKTLKYNPWFPGKFGTIDDGLEFGKFFFHWYNHEHHHSGLAYLTPAEVHHGRVDEALRPRDEALAAAYVANPGRFVHGPPRAPRPPSAVYINPPRPVSTSAPTSSPSHELGREVAAH